jgi:phosphatidylglycerophosphatase A
MNERADEGMASALRERRPWLSLFIATAAGLGNLPVAPGTWGSLGGILLAMLPWWTFAGIGVLTKFESGFAVSIAGRAFDPFLFAQCTLAIVTAGLGVWCSSRASRFWAEKDPQRVVIDEVSGQHLTLLLGCTLPVWWRVSDAPWTGWPLGLITVHAPLNWKYLLLGFILFRVFDIWKPFPARQAESLPGGWGIMADDWIAGVYAAIGLWGARALGL